MNGDHTGPVNLGNPDEYTILELAQAVQQMVILMWRLNLNLCPRMILVAASQILPEPRLG